MRFEPQRVAIEFKYTGDEMLRLGKEPGGSPIVRSGPVLDLPLTQLITGSRRVTAGRAGHIPLWPARPLAAPLGAWGMFCYPRRRLRQNRTSRAMRAGRLHMFGPVPDKGGRR